MVSIPIPHKKPPGDNRQNPQIPSKGIVTLGELRQLKQNTGGMKYN